MVPANKDVYAAGTVLDRDNAIHQTAPTKLLQVGHGANEKRSVLHDVLASALEAPLDVVRNEHPGVLSDEQIHGLEDKTHSDS